MGSCVIVTNPIHPLYGRSVVVRQIRKVGKQTKVILESPLGGLLCLPADETNLFVQVSSDRQVDMTPLFKPEKLLRLSEWVVAHSKSLTEKSSCVPEDKKVERKKKNDTKASTSAHSTFKRRKNATPDQTNSTVSGQNPQGTAAAHRIPRQGVKSREH